MIKTRKYYIWTILYILISFLSDLQATNIHIPESFESITGHHQLATLGIFCIIQDYEGYLWFGSTNGVNKYDGYRMQVYSHKDNDSTSINHSKIYCMFESADHTLYMGTERGLNIYNRKTDNFSSLQGTQKDAILFIQWMPGNILWLGTRSGILKYDLNTKKYIRYHRNNKKQYFPGNYVGCGYYYKNHFYTGTHNYLCVLTAAGSFQKIKLPFSNLYPNNLPLSITEDKEMDGYLWLGTEKGLMHYNVNTHEATIQLRDIPIKTLHYRSNKQLWIGTDNGLFIKRYGTMDFEQRIHNPENTKSIINNVIWSIFTDRNNEIWLGTDYGLSILSAHKNYKFISTHSVTGQNEGNLLNAIFKDDLSNIWLGGSNGLIRYNYKSKKSEWIKTSGAHSLSHNKIRNFYKDSHSLWIATDGGLNRYDYTKNTYQHYKIRDLANVYNSNWMYSIVEDDIGQLWIGTYAGGIFVVNKERLLQSNGHEIIADKHYTKETYPKGLSENIINAMIRTRDGIIWASTESGGINCISPKDDKISLVNNQNSQLSSNLLRCLTVDSQGDVWIGSRTGLEYMNKNKEVIKSYPEQIHGPINFLINQKKNIWLCSGSELACINTNNHKLNKIYLGNITPMCAHYSSEENKMYVGVLDGFIEFNPDELISPRVRPSIQITNLSINDQIVEVGKSYNDNLILKESLSYQKRIILNNNQNSFSLEVSSFLFLNAPEMQYASRLKGFDDSWRINAGDQNKISFVNVPAGEYQFEVCNINNTGEFLYNTTVLDVCIRPIWYKTMTANIVYTIIFLLLGFWLWRTFKTQKMLMIARIERDKTIKSIELKKNFFDNVSHEFKTPLSIIIGYVSQLVIHENNKEQMRKLSAIQDNANKIHYLINQMLDYNDKKEGTDAQLIISEVYLPELIRKSFDRFENAFALKHIKATFISEEINDTFSVDQIKMTSIFDNLLSNSLKFTPENGNIIILISKIAETNEEVEVSIRIEDDGCGITDTDLPRIFERFFRSEKSLHLNKEGSGIGLSLVKEIIELHKGKIEVQSQWGVGTSFTINLGTSKRKPFLKQTIGIEDKSPDLCLPVEMAKPIILLVEDNSEIREFIVHTLSHSYHFLEAEDGKKGLDSAIEYEPDLIILDIMMPKYNGLELAKLLKNNIKTAFIPIIVLTAKNDEKTEIEALSYVDSYFYKPFDIDYLNKFIIRLILKNRKFHEKIREKGIMEPKVEELASPDELFLSEITDLIETHLLNPDLNVTFISENSGYGNKMIYRKIKQLTGMSVVEYIRSIRLKKAALYLKQNKLTISEIIYMVGYSNPSYFTKCFKEEFGVSPKDFKNSQLQNTNKAY